MPSLLTATMATLEVIPWSSTHSENPPCMLLRLVLAHEPLGGSRDEFRGNEIDPVVSHVVVPSGVTVDWDASLNQYLWLTVPTQAKPSIAGKEASIGAYGKRRKHQGTGRTGGEKLFGTNSPGL